MILPGRDLPWRTFARELYRELLADNLLDYAGSVAFSAFLAVFPFLLFAVALASLVVDPGTLGALIEQIQRLVPAQVAQILTDRLTALTSGTRPGLLTLGAVGAIWAASGAVTALITALNIANDVRDTRPFWKTRALAILVTLAAAILSVAASTIAFAAPALARHLGGPLGLAILWLRWPAAAALMLLVIACLYHFLPDVEHRFRFLTPGSIVAVVIWVLASLGFSLYVSHFGNYEVVYGALGSVIILLLWIWLSSLVILLGAEINAVLEPRPHQEPQRSNRRPTEAPEMR